MTGPLPGAKTQGGLHEEEKRKKGSGGISWARSGGSAAAVVEAKERKAKQRQKGGAWMSSVSDWPGCRGGSPGERIKRKEGGKRREIHGTWARRPLQGSVYDLSHTWDGIDHTSWQLVAGYGYDCGLAARRELGLGLFA